MLRCFLGRGGSSGAKFRISLGLPVGAVINCADNTGNVFGVWNPVGSHVLGEEFLLKALASSRPVAA